MNKRVTVLPVVDTPEARRLWLGDFLDEELQQILRELMDMGLVQMVLKGRDRGFQLTILGRTELLPSQPRLSTELLATNGPHLYKR